MRTARWCALTAAGGLVVALAAPMAAGAASHSRGPSELSGIAAKIRQYPVAGVAKSARVDFELVLRLRHPGEARALVRAISSPGSARFRHYLSTAQWEARFSPTAAAVRRARNWLRGEGFTVGATAKDRITISASGTAAQAEGAFGTGLKYYRVNGHTVRLTTGNASVPASIRGAVLGAMGLSQNIATPDAVASQSAAHPSATSPFPPPPPAFQPSPPCGSYYNQKITTVTPPFGGGYPAKVPYEVCGYKPPQLRSAYNVGNATGKGVTVAIIDAYGSATIAQDSAHYFSLNDPTNPFSKADFTQLDAFPFDDETACGASSWAVEQALDVDSVHTMAPDAHILYVGAQDCENGLFNAEQEVIDNRLADVVTNSWGNDAGDLLDDVATKTAYDDLFMLADSTGMTVMFSSGDDGDNFNLFGFSSADYPTESPYVTSVGGTSLEIGSHGQQIGQVGWATGRSFKCTANAVNLLPGCTKSTLGTWLPVAYDGGGGGYTSYYYSQPWYQAPVVPTVLAERNFTSPARVVPDIAMDADPSTGLLIGLHEIFPNGKDAYNQPRYGGTSLASPLLAGVVADADGLAMASGGSDVGFINPVIYRLDTKRGAIDDILPAKGNQGQLRVDHAFTYLLPTSKGVLYSFRELTYEGIITYCDLTGNCATRPNTLTTAKGYDSMTGLGSIGPDFIADLAAP
jgi:subtilase family serine protease